MKIKYTKNNIIAIHCMKLQYFKLKENNPLNTYF